MVKKLSMLLIAVVTTLVALQAQEATFKANSISKQLKYCEGSVVHNGSLLVSNFGTNELNPLNTEGKGYIVKVDGGNVEEFIATDGNLSAPKGMAIANNQLFIADVGRVVVYNMNNSKTAPQVIMMPEGELYVNDIVISENVAYISVTNTGKIFMLDISNPEKFSSESLTEYATVSGANGLVLDGKTMYIASYPADGKTTSANVIYVIKNIETPQVEPYITRPSQYDGLAINNSKLYFSSWTDGAIGYVDMKSKEIKMLPISNANLVGAADISILNGKLFIPNLPASELVVVPLQ